MTLHHGQFRRFDDVGKRQAPLLVVHNMTGRLIYQARSRSLLEHTGFACRLRRTFAHRTEAEDSALPNSRPTFNVITATTAAGYRWRWSCSVRGAAMSPSLIRLPSKPPSPPGATLAADLTTREKTMIESALARRIGSSVGCEGCGRNTRHAAAHSRVEAEETRHRPTSFPIVLKRVAPLVIRSAPSKTYNEPSGTQRQK